MPIQDSYYIKAQSSGGGSVGAKLMKTGQTTSYSTGDDGDIEAGRATDFFTLASNNPFGNTNRFTDSVGGQSYSIGVLIDWSTYDGSTVLGYSGATGENTFITWSEALELANNHSVGSFTSGWRLPNVSEVLNIWNFSLNPPLAYSQWFKRSFGGVWARGAMWTSTTPARWTGGAIRTRSDNSTVDTQNKTNTPCRDGFAVRDFTVTGTTLT